MAEFLNNAVETFMNNIRPSSRELLIYEAVISDVKEAITSEWIGARVELIGSRATDLYLPESDFDFVVWNLHEVDLFDFKDVMGEWGFRTLAVLHKASVPIIKLVHKPSRLCVDIQIGDINKKGITTGWIISKCQSYPMLKPMYLFLKQQLNLANLNEVCTGGLSSFGLLLMCIGYLRLDEASRDIGSNLVGFLELFGFEFDYQNSVIHIDHYGKFTKKRSADRTSPLFVENPSLPGINVCKQTTRMNEVIRNFQLIYEKSIESEGRMRRFVPESRNYQRVTETNNGSCSIL